MRVVTVIPISKNIVFKLKIKFIRDKEWYYILIKVLIQQEDIKIINICAPNHKP